jgi:hypothetical protein
LKFVGHDSTTFVPRCATASAGAGPAVTVTVKLHESVPPALVAVTVTVLVPTGKANGDVMAEEFKLYFSAGVGKPLAVAANETNGSTQSPPVAFVTTFAGQFTMGDALTVSENAWLATVPTLLLAVIVSG